MDTAEIKRRWLEFFGTRDHIVVPSSSLLSDDPNLLFVPAGMVPFKPYFLGQETPPYKRATSVQKCVRTLDIEEVGQTTRHGTFFQMNGNFSFGDYFKERAIELAWELCTRSRADGGFGFPESKLLATVYQDDDEAFGLWRKIAGLTDGRIVRLGKKENYWHMGVPGPGGPCSEILIDRDRSTAPRVTSRRRGTAISSSGTSSSCSSSWARYAPRTTSTSSATCRPRTSTPGMGLERVAFLLQGVDNIYEIDEVRPVLDLAADLAKKTYGASHPDDVRLRVVADHVRSALMLINDGVTPATRRAATSCAA
jgi:alanyl-tRNA synthetase